MPATTASSSPLVDHQAEGALTEADRGVELCVERQVAGVEPLERGAVGRVAPGELDEAGADVDPVHQRSRVGELARMTSRPAPDVEHALPGVEPERVDQELDLLRASPS